MYVRTVYMYIWDSLKLEKKLVMYNDHNDIVVYHKQFDMYKMHVLHFTPIRLTIYIIINRPIHYYWGSVHFLDTWSLTP